MAVRQIVLDTETTGLNARTGDRVVEIGCIELRNRRVTDRHFHTYLNPEREIEEGAARVHGLTLEFLSDKPRFAEVAKDFLDYVRGAELVIHNAEFDVEFLDLELGRLKLGKLAGQVSGIIDTLALARELHPGKRNNLNALCERYGVDHAQRKLHGALLDAELLAEVYLAMTRGQESLMMMLEGEDENAAEAVRIDGSKLVVLRASAEERALHDEVMADIERESGGTVWKRRGADPG